MAHLITNVIYNTKIASLHFEPNKEEVTFLQLIGQDKLITNITLDILNILVIQKMTTNLDTKTKETKHNGQVIKNLVRHVDKK